MASTKKKHLLLCVNTWHFSLTWMNKPSNTPCYSLTIRPSIQCLLLSKMKRKSAGERLPDDASETAWPGVSSVWQTGYHSERYGALTASNWQECPCLCFPHTAGVTPAGRMWTLQAQKIFKCHYTSCCFIPLDASIRLTSHALSIITTSNRR